MMKFALTKGLLGKIHLIHDICHVSHMTPATAQKRFPYL